MTAHATRHLVPALVRVVVALIALLAPVTQAKTARAADHPEWAWPLAGTPVVDRAFTPPASAWGAGHRGVDLRGDIGEPVLAAGTGRVTYSGLLAGRGVVTVTHDNGLRTTYEPVETSVSVGDLVDAGDVLGALTTGHASCRLGTVCLHWGLLRGDTYLDPAALVRQGKLRLLPIGATAPALGTAAASGPWPLSTPAPPAPDAGPRPRSAHPAMTAVANVAGVTAVGFALIVGLRRLRRHVRSG